jgi:dGTP triphosphohydrolase
MFPRGVRDLLESSSSKNEQTRIVVDTIASMTEQQAVEMYQRLKAISFGSVLKSVM